MVLAFGAFRRGGSSIGFMLLQHLLIESGLTCSDRVRELWDQGITEPTGRHVLPALRQNDLVGCFRSAPVMSQKSLANARLFLLVRDPRDCQVSWYHARHLHQDEETENVILDDATIDEDLIKEETFDADVASLLDWCELSGGRIFRYEDMVTNPLTFIMEFAEFSGLPIKRSAIDLALLEATFFQPALDHGNHNRSGVPYEALRTLPQQQLEKLNDRFAPLLNRLGYPLDPAELPELEVEALVQRDATKRYVLGLAEQNALRAKEIVELKQDLANLRSEFGQAIGALAEQNGLRVVEIAEQNRALARVRSDMEDHVRDLPNQNGQRIVEIAELRRDLATIEAEVGSHLRKLPDQNNQRIIEIADLREGLANVIAELSTHIRSLPEENGMRIVEIGELRNDLAGAQFEIERLKIRGERSIASRFLRRER